jgi:predicted TPR repeat methyltransferase
MNPVLLSSGDLIADRRADYAESLFAGGETEAAADLMAQALELAPGWTAGWFRLGEMHDASDKDRPAAEAFRKALQLDPEDRLGAALKLALVEKTAVPPAPPSAYVEMLFDQYAEGFDESLVEKLGYRVPGLIGRALAGMGHVDLALDLGCGTGLMAPILRPLAGRLAGLDISMAMLRHAQQRGLYDELIKADLTIDPLPAADLVVAADVLMYVGELASAFSAIASALREGGYFAFSVEADDHDDLVLRESRRFSHGQPYVEEMLRRHGFSLMSLARHAIRLDRGEAIEGFIVVARKRA